MRKTVKYFAINTYSLYLTTLLAKGFVFKDGLLSFIYTGAALTIGSFLLKPIINLLLLPLNLITFGIFRWVSFAFILYLVSWIVKSFQISYFYFSGFSSKWIDIPEIYLKGFLAYVAFSFILSLIISFIHWITN